MESLFALPHLPHMLEVRGPPRREGPRVGILGAAVGIMRHLRPLDPGPYLLVEEVKVAHVRISVGPRGYQILHVGHCTSHPTPHASIEGAVVVRVVAEGVDAMARGDPLLDGKPLTRVETAARKQEGGGRGGGGGGVGEGERGEGSAGLNGTSIIYPENWWSGAKINVWTILGER